MSKHYRFAYRRSTGKLIYRWIWAASLPQAWQYAVQYLDNKPIFLVGYRPMKLG